MRERVQVFAHVAPFRGLVEVLFVSDTRGMMPGDQYEIALPMQWQAVEFGKPLPVDQEPSLRLHRDVAQALVDELWRLGIRPADAGGSAGSLEATRAHLADMRALVFSRVPGVKP